MGSSAPSNWQFTKKTSGLHCKEIRRQSAIFFLVQGTFAARKKRFENAKALSDQNTQLTRSYEGPCVYGERIFLTEEPRLESVRATNRCLIWVLRKDAFWQLFNSLPVEKQRQVLEYAYNFRRELMPKVLPVSGADLRCIHLFSHIPVEHLNALAAKMEPRVFGACELICQTGDIGHEMYYVARGAIDAIITTVEGDVSKTVRNGCGSIVGEASVLFSQKRNLTLKAAMPTDVYVITRDMLASTLQNPAWMGQVLQKAHALQAEWRQQAKTRFLDLIANIPFIKQLASKKLILKLLDGFESRVYPIRSTILSVSECADRLVIFTRGKARISASSIDLAIGECVGFTCLVPHRWRFHVVAQETVESIELHYRRFKALLREFGLLDKIRFLTSGLLYPRAHPDAFQQALPMVRHCCNPPSFPTSTELDPKPFAARANLKKSPPRVVSADAPQVDSDGDSPTHQGPKGRFRKSFCVASTKIASNQRQRGYSCCGVRGTLPRVSA